MEKVKRNWLKVIRHEFAEYLWLLIYMAWFFWVFATYRMLILRDWQSAGYEYATGFVNALVLSKVVLIGQHARVGTRHEHRSLIISSIYKSFIFSVLVGVFHVIEDFIKELLHGKSLDEAIHELTSLNYPRLAALTVLVFCVFIPFFAVWETRRVLGAEEFDRLFLHRHRANKKQHLASFGNQEHESTTIGS